MNRKELVGFINDSILPQLHYTQRLCVKPSELLRMVEQYRIGKPKNHTMTATVNDGFLAINGCAVGRIAAKLPKVMVTDEACYWEGRCLAMAEAY